MTTKYNYHNIQKGWDYLELERYRNIKNTNTTEAIKATSDLFESARYLNPPKSTSGLIEMRKIFDRTLRKK